MKDGEKILGGGERKVIYTVERRCEFGGGSMESHYEARSYERRTPTGVLVGGKLLKKCKTKQQARDYFARKGVEYEE